MQNSRPCDGIKVLAVTSALAAPFAAYQLALHGAEVISIEDPGTGNTTRRAGSIEGRNLSEQGMAAGFIAHAANKKSLTLNLREPAAQEIFRKLAMQSDVILENFRAGTMDRYGLGYEAMRELNPRIVYCSLSGFGQTGPKRRDPAIDPIIQAASGMMSLTGTPQSGPLKVGAQIADYASGFSLTLGIMMALFQRERTGEGQRVDVSMLETAIVFMSNTVSDVMNTGMPTRLMGNKLQNNNHLCDTFACSDAPIFIGATRENLRQKLWEAMGRPDIPADPRFRNLTAIQQNLDAMYAEIGRTLKTKTAAEWEDILSQTGVPAMQVRTIAEITDHPQIQHRKLFHTIDKASSGLGQDVRVPLAPYKLSKGAARIDSPPPFLGRHTEEILGGLGYSNEEIGRLRATGVV